MTGPICHWCGGYPDGFDEHDEDAGYREHCGRPAQPDHAAEMKRQGLAAAREEHRR